MKSARSPLKNAPHKVPTGIAGLDEITGGGLPRGRTTLLLGNAPNSVTARVNLAALCRTYLPERHEIEIVDVFRHPKRALVDGILMTPTLVRVAPAPICRIVGTLSQTVAVVLAFGLETGAT